MDNERDAIERVPAGVVGWDECDDDQPMKCPSCGVAYVEHMGLIGTCAEVRRLREELQHEKDVRRHESALQWRGGEILCNKALQRAGGDEK